MKPLRHTWQVTLRYLRALFRQPAWIGITLIQPMIWLLLFGGLFKSIARIPGFHGGSYIEFLTPGLIVMLAISSAGWSGMAYIEDMNLGVMDRFLVSPIWRGALNAGSVAQQVIVIARESLIGAVTSVTLPLTFLSAAFMQQTLMPHWIQTIARYNPVNWAVQAGRSAATQHTDWSLVGSRIGFLTALLLVSGWLATRAFRAYQRSI